MARLQQESGELWGRHAVWGARPMAQAYGGPLPEGVRGIEFTTDVTPDPGGKPSLPTWSGPRAGVVIEGEFAKIRITVTKNTQT